MRNMKANTSCKGEEKIAKRMQLKVQRWKKKKKSAKVGWGSWRGFSALHQGDIKRLSWYLFYGEGTVWSHLSSSPHAALPEIDQHDKNRSKSRVWYISPGKGRKPEKKWHIWSGSQEHGADREGPKDGIDPPARCMAEVHRPATAPGWPWGCFSELL